jgi:hypothetical protein
VPVPVGKLRFDERLPLCGWLEDIEFTSQLRRNGRVVELRHVLGVHLGVRSGGPGKRQAARIFAGNEPHLFDEVGNRTFFIRDGAHGRNVIANLIRSLWPEAHVDKVGAPQGKLHGCVARNAGRIEPEYILKIGGTASVPIAARRRLQIGKPV